MTSCPLRSARQTCWRRRAMTVNWSSGTWFLVTTLATFVLQLHLALITVQVGQITWTFNVHSHRHRSEPHPVWKNLYTLLTVDFGVCLSVSRFYRVAITLSNIRPNQFSKLFYCQNQEKSCINTVTKDPTTLKVCCYTTLWNVTEWGKLLLSFTDHAIGQWRHWLECVVQQSCTVQYCYKHYSDSDSEIIS